MTADQARALTETAHYPDGEFVPQILANVYAAVTVAARIGKREARVALCGFGNPLAVRAAVKRLTDDGFEVVTEPHPVQGAGALLVSW